MIKTRILLFFISLALLSNFVYASTQEASTTNPVPTPSGGDGGGGGGNGISTNNVTVTTKIADFNSDGRVNIFDLSILLYYIERPSPIIGNYDLNKDGKVDIFDISIIFYYWNV